MDKHSPCYLGWKCANILTIMRAGDTLGGRYVLEQLLGKGGMGVVWSAYDRKEQRRVAVKLIIPQNEESLTRELRQRLLREAGACAKLQHPNIIQVYEVGETDSGDAYMVLELLEGQALGDLLKQKRRLDPKLAARIGADIASGLAEAHAAKVIHRDLKPANIYLHREPGMAEDEFVTKILDFGVCVDRESMDTVKTQTGIAVGSPAYMSPEQIAMRKDIDGRTDIWSLGLIVYEMVTGMRAFNGTVLNVRAQILTQPVDVPSSKVRDVPPDLDAVVARCTQGRRDLRYAEAGELARDLYCIAGARPAVRQPSTSRPSLVKQIGLADMFDAEIKESPAVPKPGGARTFNPAGATLPLIPRERRAETEKLPPVIDEVDDLAATLPLQAKMLLAARPKVLDEAPDAAAGTQLMRAGTPVPSPDPAWKREMEQALEVHRQSSMSLPRLELDVPDDAAGGTQMLPSKLESVRPDVPIRSDETGTTAAAGAMSREIRLPLRSMPDPAVITGRRRSRRKGMLFAAAGFLVVSFSAMVGIAVYKGTPVANHEVAVLPSVVLPLPPVTIASADAVLASAAAPPLNVPAIAPSASVGLPGATTAVPEVPATNASAVASAATSVPTNAPMGTAKASVPVSTGRPAMRAPKKMVEVCTGAGVFRRCKMVPQ